MKPLVIDASVAAKWFLPEPDADKARALLQPRRRLIAPDLLWIEIAQVGWKLARRGLLDPSEAEHIVQDMQIFPVEPFDSQPLLPAAMRLALEYDRTVYDCLYLALALAADGVLITADRRLLSAFKAGSLQKRLRLLDAPAR